MKALKIAIIGAGFSGLASAYHLSRFTSKGFELKVDIIDPGEIGENSSGISAGLLHPFAGAHAKLVYRGIESLTETLKLTSASENALNKNIAINTGLLRIAVTEEQKQDFAKTAESYEEVEWWEESMCKSVFPFLASNPAIYIASAYTVRTKDYLEGLWKECQTKGMQWKNDHILSLRQLEGYDAVIAAGGASTKLIEELSHLPITPVKGQILEIEWPENFPSLKMPVNSKAYLVQTEDPKKYALGATFERNFHDSKPDVEYAVNYLFPKMTEIIPDLESAKVLGCLSGIRASTPNHFPIARRETKNLWIIAGMGSKGLLYHALYSKELVENLIRSFHPSAFS